MTCYSSHGHLGHPGPTIPSSLGLRLSCLYLLSAYNSLAFSRLCPHSCPCSTVPPVLSPSTWVPQQAAQNKQRQNGRTTSTASRPTRSAASSQATTISSTCRAISWSMCSTQECRVVRPANVPTCLPASHQPAPPLTKHCPSQARPLSSARPGDKAIAGRRGRLARRIARRRRGGGQGLPAPGRRARRRRQQNLGLGRKPGRAHRRAAQRLGTTRPRRSTITIASSKPAPCRRTSSGLSSRSLRMPSGAASSCGRGRGGRGPGRTRKKKKMKQARTERPERSVADGVQAVPLG